MIDGLPWQRRGQRRALGIAQIILVSLCYSPFPSLLCPLVFKAQPTQMHSLYLATVACFRSLRSPIPTLFSSTSTRACMYERNPCAVDLWKEIEKQHLYTQITCLTITQRTHDSITRTGCCSYTINSYTSTTVTAVQYTTNDTHF